MPPQDYSFFKDFFFYTGLADLAAPSTTLFQGPKDPRTVSVDRLWWRRRRRRRRRRERERERSLLTIK